MSLADVESLELKPDVAVEQNPGETLWGWYESALQGTTPNRVVIVNGFVKVVGGYSLQWGEAVLASGLPISTIENELPGMSQQDNASYRIQGEGFRLLLLPGSNMENLFTLFDED